MLTRLNCRVAFLNDMTNPRPPTQTQTPSKKKKQKSQKHSATDMYPPLSPEPLYDALYRSKSFDYTKKGRQEDAEEFCGFLLEGLERELLQGCDEVGNTEMEDETWMEVGPRKKTLMTRKVRPPSLVLPQNSHIIDNPQNLTNLPSLWRLNALCSEISRD